MMEGLYDLRGLTQQSGVSYGEILLHETQFASVLTVHRPEVRNALDLDAIRAFSAFVDQIANRPSAERIATLVFGAGGSFISGGDLKALHERRDGSTAKEMSTLMRNALNTLRAQPGLLVMVADGPIVGGGAEVFIAGDYRFMSSTSHLRFAQSRLGLSTGWGGARRLSQLVGRSGALALLLDGERLTAKRCYDLKLAHRIIESKSSFEAAIDWLRVQSERPLAVFGIKRMLSNLDYGEIDQLESELFPSLWTSSEHWNAVDELWKRREAKRSNEPKSELSHDSVVGLKEGLMENTNDVNSAVNEEGLKPHKRGLFVVLEGIDGAGTTTQAKRIVKTLETLGRKAYITQEPSGGLIGKLTRRALRGDLIGIGTRPLPAESIALLFAADRADHWHNEIEPRLERGEDVICDRYLYSSLAYQGIELPESWVRALNQTFPQPDLLLFVEVVVGVAAKRRAARGEAADRYEVDDLQQKIATRYSSICREFQAHMINGGLPIDEVTNACLEALTPLLKVSGQIKKRDQV